MSPGRVVGGPSAPQMTAAGQEPQEGYVRCVHDAGSWEGILLSPTGQQLEKETCSLFFLSQTSGWVGDSTRVGARTRCCLYQHQSTANCWPPTQIPGRC